MSYLLFLNVLCVLLNGFFVVTRIGKWKWNAAAGLFNLFVAIVLAAGMAHK